MTFNGEQAGAARSLFRHRNLYILRMYSVNHKLKVIRSSVVRHLSSDRWVTRKRSTRILDSGLKEDPIGKCPLLEVHIGILLHSCIYTRTYSQAVMICWFLTHGEKRSLHYGVRYSRYYLGVYLGGMYIACTEYLDS